MNSAKSRGTPIIGIVNAPFSTIARLSDRCFYLNAGKEIGVAATKSFTLQLLVLLFMALFIAKEKGRISAKDLDGFFGHISALPEKIYEVLMSEAKFIRLVEKYFVSAQNSLFLGRSYSYPVALEGALKMKEISYIHAEGISAAEMKHGPLALVDRDIPVVFIMGNREDVTYEKIISNMHEVKSREGRILAFVNHKEPVSLPAEEIITLPETISELTPFINAVALQFLALHAGVMRGCDVDKPRNLAKSVTVE